MTVENTPTGFEIAVIGMAGRFPGARYINEFWDNLKNGVESISFFADKELKKAGIDTRQLVHSDYVKASAMLEAIDYFDSVFFGYTPAEAEIMDPQVRIYHEITWEALEDAGIDPDRSEGLIGLYAGASYNHYWEFMCIISGKNRKMGSWAAAQYIDKDYFTMRISYALNLKGPSFSMYTACSTSLAAVHLACQALLNGECDVALAGGVTILLPNKMGYQYQKGMILSPDGHCRTFDAKAQGIVSGSGAGVVVLKLLENAIADGNHIYAIVKGSAINNDGMRKSGFTAPSVEGQADVIQTARQMAHVEPESISYVETHGTGTSLGDPIEIDALTLAFNTDKKGFCAIGSVKTNIGHLDSAAGIAGFIKTVLALANRLIPPGIHFENPNPAINFESSPFYVNTGLKEWKNEKYPLRAGVSSFGIGGTNAHVVLEEWPGASTSKRQDSSESEDRNQHLILLSAKTETALDKMTENLANHLNQHPNINLADAAYTLQVGRKNFQHRRMLVCSGNEDAAAALSSFDAAKIRTLYLEKYNKTVNQPIVFMFPGQGSQYIDMGRELYQTEPVFREEIDQCFEILKQILDYDIKEILYPPATCNQHLSPDINQTQIAQPLLFVFEYALAKLIMKWGITPQVMIGHSIGEYVAAHLSGVVSLEDALHLVVLRGLMMQQLPCGAMLSVPLPETDIKPMLSESIELAAVNSPGFCVISGTGEDVESFMKALSDKGIDSRLLHTSHAFHSRLMDPILEEFAEKAESIKFNPPQIPYISNVTGKWITHAEVSDPAYWSKHIRNTVRFSAGVENVLAIIEETGIFLEIGPGRVLSGFVEKHLSQDNRSRYHTLNLVRHPRENIADSAYLLDRIGQLWLYGENINWCLLHENEKRRFISLPTYPFEGLHFPVEEAFFKGKKPFAGKSKEKKNDMADWCYVPSWQRSPLTANQPGKLPQGINWLLFSDEDTNTPGIGAKLGKYLGQMNQEAIVVKMGAEFKEIGRHNGHYEFIIAPGQPEGYDRLFQRLKEMKRIPVNILHLWGVYAENPDNTFLERLDRTQDIGLFSLLNIVRAIGAKGISNRIQLGVLTNNMQEVTGGELTCPEKATMLGAVKIIPMEYDNIHCRSVDIILPLSDSKQEEQLLRQLLAEFSVQVPHRDVLVAYRGNFRWVQRVKAIRLNNSGEPVNRFREQGVYLITGGFGGMGFTLARYLGENFKARLILVGRSPFPERDHWQQWLETHDSKDPVSQKIKIIRELEAQGTRVMVACADVSDLDRMKKVIALALDRFGRINGILHTAGIADYAGVIQRRTRLDSEKIMSPKVKGTLVLYQLVEAMKIKENLDFIALFSSIGNYIYGIKFGQVGYNAANEFLDAFACYNNAKQETFTVSINWDDWQQVGMSVAAVQRKEKGKANDHGSKTALIDGLTPPEGVELFSRIMQSILPHIIISTRNLNGLMARFNVPGAFIALEKKRQKKEVSRLKHKRPQLSTTYVEPASELEKILVDMWQDYLGINQVGIHDNFFDLGASSLDVIQVTNKINKKFKTDIPVVVLFENTTVKSLARYLHINIDNIEAGELNYRGKTKRTAEIEEGKKAYQKRLQKRKATTEKE